MQFTHYYINIFCSSSPINIFLKWVAIAFMLLLPNSLSQHITTGCEKVFYTDTASDIPAVDDLFLRYCIALCMRCSWLVKHVFGMLGWLHIQQAALNTAEPHVALKLWDKLFVYPASYSHAHRYTVAVLILFIQAEHVISGIERIEEHCSSLSFHTGGKKKCFPHSER